MRSDRNRIENGLGFINGVSAFLRLNNGGKTRFIGVPSTETAEDDCAFTLQKEPGRDFVILNITDPHFADCDVRALMAFTESVTIRRLVKAVKPDLITVTGDLVCSDRADFSLKRICALFESFGVPWAPVFGNHEDESNMDKNYMADVFLSCPHCLFKKNAPEMGVGNYMIHIAEGERIVESVFMMDSGHSQANEAQREWFRRKAQEINRASGSQTEISVMFHIPLPEYQYAYDAAWEIFPKKWKKEYEAHGELHENICCEKRDGVPVQRGFFPLMQRLGTVKYVFCGHEHLIDFSILYQGVRLTYTMKVGPASGGGFALNGGTEIRVGGAGIHTIYQKTVAYGPIVNKETIHTKQEKEQ